MQYVALVQQGMIVDQRAVAISTDQVSLTAEANRAAQELNDAQTGESEGWTAVVLPVGEQH